MAALLGVIPVSAERVCAHDFQPVEEPATCTESGYRGYVCSLCFQTRDYEVIPQLEHDWSEWLVSKPASCAEKGLQSRNCGFCNETEEVSIERLPHEYESWVKKPSCGLNGYTLHQCIHCGHEEKTDYVDALGHDLEAYVVDPTCTKDGYTRLQCTRCTYSRNENPVKKTGHLYDSGTVEKEAGLHENGKIRYDCLNCDETRVETVSAWENPFVDVDSGIYYRDSVTWAYHMGITTGTDDTHFSPEGTCTRAQVVTFLWRWAGCPKANNANHGFVDVERGSYYEEAVRWAVEKGITNGVDQTHFAPNQGCTRCQVVTLLHRYQGSPVPKGESPFVDVMREDYFAQPVLWAYKSKITTGVDTSHFSPNGLCTRGQIVTFLFRASEQ